MINFYEQVPSVYINASRDFQYMSWLINIVFNSVKHNVDDMYQLPCGAANPKLNELLALTLGFKLKRNYEQKQLAALVSIIPSILRYKGTITAINMAGEALVAASGSTGSFRARIDEKNISQLNIEIPEALIDVTLLIDLLDYILPAGMTYRIIRSQFEETLLDPIEVEYSDLLRIGTDGSGSGIHESVYLNNNTGVCEGLASLYIIKAGKQEFAANFIEYKQASDGKTEIRLIPNTGLYSNSIIPNLREGIPVISGPAEDVPITPSDIVTYLTDIDGVLLQDSSGTYLIADNPEALLKTLKNASNVNTMISADPDVVINSMLSETGFTIE